jgi:DNA polymerase V
MSRYIGLIDCNNFFVSCERLFRPDLVRVPVIVLSSNDGCIISRSEEAKQLGFTMGEPYFKVRDRCKTHNVAIFSSNFPLYRDMSRRVMYTIHRHVDNVEVYSVDEAFIELSLPEHKLNEHATSLRNAIFRDTGIPVAVGLGHTKTLAKVATHYAKPKRGGSGVYVLSDDADTRVKLEHLSVGDVWGVGFRYAPMLKRIGIHTAYDLVRKDNAFIRKRMSIRGLRTVEELRGKVCLDVGEDTTLRKSLLHSQSFGARIYEYSELEAAVARHARKVAEVLRAEDAVAREVGVVIRTSRHTEKRYGAFDIIILEQHTGDTIAITEAALTLLRGLFRDGYAYAKAGVTVRDITPRGAQPVRTLFGTESDPRAPLMDTLDDIRHRLGDVIHLGVERVSGGWRPKSERLSPRYTTRWDDVPTISTG